MARSYANIFTAIWRDDEFRALDGEAQRVYLLLATQPNISAAGMLPMTVARWAAMSASTKPADIRSALSRLTDAHFVIADDDTEEVLVRSFVRHDKGYGNPKRVPVIRDAARDIESRRLRQALAVELVRLDLPPEWTGELPVEPDPDGPPDNHPDSLSPPDSAASDRAVVDQSSSHVDSLSDSHAHTVSPSERYRDTKATYVETLNPVPQTASLVPSPAPPETSRARASKRETRIPDDFALTEEMAQWGRENAPNVNGAYETAKFIDYWRAKSGKDATKKDWVATWRNWIRKANESLPSNVVAIRRPSTTDQRVQAGLDLAAKYAEEDTR
jgi:hypothetical protein